MKKKTLDDFIKEAKKVHGDKYDYSKVEYINTMTKVCIICPKHGEFWQIPNSHLKGFGCIKCKNQQLSKNKTLSKEQFIEKANIVHNNKYDYTNSVFISTKHKVNILCEKHGEFIQSASSHLQGHGCPKCALEETSKRLLDTKETFITKARKIHGDKYDYSKVEYVNSQTKVCIICPIHGEFWQKPNYHLCGYGCKTCNESHLEKEINDFLIENNINFERQKRFDWLGLQSLDFYLPDYNIAIECQGIQHFEPIDFFGGINEFEKTIKRDIVKKQLCYQNDIKLIYYTNIENKNIITNKNDILNIIN